MDISNNPKRWGTLTQLLHWTIVALIVTQFVLALSADDLPSGMRKLALLARHKSFGITILVLAAIRLAWRRLSPGPALPAGLKPWERVLAHVTHHGLYLLLFLTPLAGWAMSSAKNFHVSWFGWVQLPDLIGPSDAAFRFLDGTHSALAWSLGALAVLHALAALRHHFMLHDDVLRRMLPFTRLGVAAAIGLAALAAPGGARAAQWSVDVAGSSMNFTFVQAGAKTTGRFGAYSARVQSPQKALEGGSLSVAIQVASLDTADKDRDSTLRGADLLDVARFATAEFQAAKLVPAGPGKLAATGTLRIRDVTRRVTLILGLRPGSDQAVWLTGSTTLHRLDYGVGQGEWKSTEWVADEVTVSWSLHLLPVATAAVPSASSAAGR
jgi:cytochrome b561/polyisoprenoid-binding protein YceI